jgi:hypothetical protein
MWWDSVLWWVGVISFVVSGLYIVGATRKHFQEQFRRVDANRSHAMPQGFTVLELVEQYGPVVFTNNEHGVLITAGTNHLIWWLELSDGTFASVNRWEMGFNFYELNLGVVVGYAEAWHEHATKRQ